MEVLPSAHLPKSSALEGTRNYLHLWFTDRAPSSQKASCLLLTSGTEPCFEEGMLTAMDPTHKRLHQGKS